MSIYDELKAKIKYHKHVHREINKFTMMGLSMPETHVQIKYIHHLDRIYVLITFARENLVSIITQESTYKLSHVPYISISSISKFILKSPFTISVIISELLEKEYLYPSRLQKYLDGKDIEMNSRIFRLNNISITRLNYLFDKYESAIEENKSVSMILNNLQNCIPLTYQQIFFRAYLDYKRYKKINMYKY